MNKIDRRRQQLQSRRAVMLSTLAIGALAISQAVSGPRFEAASIRPLNPGERGSLPSPSFNGWPPGYTPGRVYYPGSSLSIMVLEAYGVSRFEFDQDASSEAMPVLARRFSMEGRAAGNAAGPELQAMMRGLLEDRLKIKTAWETKPSSAYVLRLDGAGPKEVSGEVPNSTLVYGVKPWGDIVHALVGVLQTPVVDETGLHGSYLFDMKSSEYCFVDVVPLGAPPKDPAPDCGGRMAAIDLIEKNLKLKVEPRTKIATPYFVIKHIEMPSPD